jgi:DNA ligase-1
MDVDSPPSDSGKKRHAKEEEEDTEDEPPTKRQRRKPTKESEASKKSKAAPKKSEKSPAKPKKTAVKAEAVEPEDDDDEVAAPVKAVKGWKLEAARSPVVQAEEDDASSKEGEEILSSDEEPEEVKKKVRAKVQTTLQSNRKDLYPDWKAGDPVPYAALCTTFSKVEMTTKRLEILAHCSLFLRPYDQQARGRLHWCRARNWRVSHKESHFREYWSKFATHHQRSQRDW